jgi:hypothetical protein
MKKEIIYSETEGVKLRKHLAKTYEDNLLGKIVGFADALKLRPIWEKTRDTSVSIIDWKPIISKLKQSHTNLKHLNICVGEYDGIVLTNDGTPIILNRNGFSKKANYTTLFFDGKVNKTHLFENLGIYISENGKPVGTPILSITVCYDDMRLMDKEAELWSYLGDKYEETPHSHHNIRSLVKLIEGIEEIED